MTKKAVTENKDNVVSLNSEQAEMNAILSSGKFILLSSDGRNLIKGMNDNPQLLMAVLDSAKNSIIIACMEYKVASEIDAFKAELLKEKKAESGA